MGVSAIVRKLIQRDHNVNAYDGSGWMLLQNAAFYGHTKVAKELIGAKANVHLKVKGPGRNVLRIAAYYIFQMMMKICVLCSRLTLDAGVGIDEQDCFFEGRTALMLAAQKGHSAVVAELVKAGADVNVKDRNGMTAVLLAWNYDVIRQLGIQDAGGVEHLSTEDRSRILWHACDKDDLDMVQSVIREGCDVNHIHKGQTPVMMATLRGHDSIVKELILANCDVNQHSKGYYSDLRSSLSLGRQFLPSATILIAIMVPLFALTIYGIGLATTGSPSMGQCMDWLSVTACCSCVCHSSGLTTGVMACSANLGSGGFQGSDDDDDGGSSSWTSGLDNGCSNSHCGAAVGVGTKSNSGSNCQILGVQCKGFCIWFCNISCHASGCRCTHFYISAF